MVMRDALRTRFYVEVVLGAATLGLFVVTLIWNDWIELLFKVDPDASNGSLEYFICFVLLAATAISWWFARTEWRRAQGTQRAF
jgi:hypothetical protein